PQVPATDHVICHSPGELAIWPRSVDSFAYLHVGWSGGQLGSIARRISTCSNRTRRCTGAVVPVQPAKTCLATRTFVPFAAAIVNATWTAFPVAVAVTRGALTLPRSTTRTRSFDAADGRGGAARSKPYAPFTSCHELAACEQSLYAELPFVECAQSASAPAAVPSLETKTSPSLSPRGLRG